MNEPNTHTESEAEEVSSKETHPLIQLGVVAVGTKVGATLILKLARYPLLLFGMGVASGFYLNKNRKDIIEAANQLKEQSKRMISKKADD
ncbi:MAG: hypothetical protein ACU85E_06115 [Gammaproteobacteria bacterium]